MRNGRGPRIVGTQIRAAQWRCSCWLPVARQGYRIWDVGLGTGSLHGVMAGLVSAIHAFPCSTKYVDARDKPGHDGLCKSNAIALGRPGRPSHRGSGADPPAVSAGQAKACRLRTAETLGIRNATFAAALPSHRNVFEEK